MLMSQNYATKRNSRFNNPENHIVDVKTRWKNTFNAAPKYQQNIWTHMLNSAVNEFRLRNPNIKKWEDLDLAEAKEIVLSEGKIDTTMQRYLNINWVITLLANFRATKVVPIQVYKDQDKNVLAWDGQHTMMLLWVIAVFVLNVEPAHVTIPVNIYKSSKKNEIRDNYISLNGGDGKCSMDTFDILEQMIYGCRIDNSPNPEWIAAEMKQQSLEKFGFFMTAEKFGDQNEIGAISRLHEIKSLDPTIVEWLVHYLAMVCQGNRVAEEKELYMMGNYFKYCKAANISVDDDYIAELATIALKLWDADFSPEGKFWNKASVAYYNWHNNNSFGTAARFNKNATHGMPFLLAQLAKSFSKTIPANHSGSEFVPATVDLF
jgi:hypothetical protein